MDIKKKLDLVLLVEDDDDIREIVREILREEDYLVMTAINGQDALSMLSKIDRPCLILLDLTMPVMNGAEFLTLLRTSPLHHALVTIPVVIQTAELNPSSSVTKYARGLIKKPINMETLLDTVRQYCRKKSDSDQKKHYPFNPPT